MTWFDIFCSIERFCFSGFWLLKNNFFIFIWIFFCIRIRFTEFKHTAYLYAISVWSGPNPTPSTSILHHLICIVSWIASESIKALVVISFLDLNSISEVKTSINLVETREHFVIIDITAPRTSKQRKGFVLQIADLDQDILARFFLS